MLGEKTTGKNRLRGSEGEKDISGVSYRRKMVMVVMSWLYKMTDDYNGEKI